MGVLMTVGTVFFAILCVLLIIIILLQSDKAPAWGFWAVQPVGLRFVDGGRHNQGHGRNGRAFRVTGSLGLAILESYRTKSVEKDLLDEGAKTSGVIEEKSTTPAKPATAPETK